MIKITIEIFPFGKEKFKRHIGTMIITNDGTGTKEIGNYNVKLSKFKSPDVWWKEGRVEGFDRKRKGPYDLIYRALHNLLAQRNKETIWT